MKPYYEDSQCTIYHGDCREVLPLVDYGAIVSDPPYGIGESLGKNKTRNQLAEATDYGSSEWDKDVAQDVFDMLDHSKDIIWFGGNYYNVPPSSCWLVWDKENSGDFADCELAWTNLKMAVRIVKHRWNGMVRGKYMGIKEQRFHPTQKPVAVMRFAIEKIKDSELVILDPFMGSGTTLRAAKDLNRKAIGIELNEKYCEIAAKRLEQGALDLGHVA